MAASEYIPPARQLGEGQEGRSRFVLRTPSFWVFEGETSYRFLHIGTGQERNFGAYSSIAALMSTVYGPPYVSWGSPEFYERLSRWISVQWPYYAAVYFHDSRFIPTRTHDGRAIVTFPACGVVFPGEGQDG
jgi:hypothetical protein